jgi:L-malate glycosyltransferase
MRICYVAHSNSHFTRPYVDYFNARGHEVHLVSFHPRDLPGAIMHHPASSAFDPEADKIHYLWRARKTAGMIRKIRPDIVHAHYVTSNGLVAALSGSHPFVVSARGTDVHGSINSWIRRELIKYVMKRADLVNAVSGEIERLVLSLGIPGERILRLTQGVVPASFRCDRSVRRAGPVRMICTRPLAQVYQPDLLLAALQALAASGRVFEFTFGAAGPMERGMRREVERTELSHVIRFLGGFEQNMLPALLAGTDIYVSASRTDGSSPALLEAMSSGAFPVVSDIPANREWITGRGDGLLFDPHDAGDCVKQLTWAMEDETLRRAAIDVNRKRVHERGDRDVNMGVLAAAYEGLLRRR